jgi:hypothetical protein
MNPFVAGASGTRMGRPLQKAFGEVIRHIGLQTSIVAVVGSAGTGKSLLADMTARACVDMGLTVRRIDSGDQVHALFGAKSDVLLIDQTDSMPASSLQTLLSLGGKNTATTMVFLCLPSCVGQVSFSGADRATIELTPLSLSDARNYLQERAASIGRTNLYSPEALDLLIDGSRGLPRLLRSIAHQAYWTAAAEGASQIGAQHVSNASGSLGVEPDKTDAHNARPQATRDEEGGEPGAKTQFRFGAGTKENASPVRTSERIVDVSDSRARDERVAGTISRDVAVKPQTRSPLISPAQQRAVKKITPADSVKESRGRERRWIDIWMPRIAGLAGAVAIGAVAWFILMMLISSKPVAVPSAARAPSAMVMPARSQPAVAPPASTPATNSVAAVPPAKDVASKDSVGLNSVVTKATVAPPASTPATNSIAVVPPAKVAPSKDSASLNSVVTKAAVQPIRENAAVGQSGAAPKAVDDKRGAQTERTGGIAITKDPIPSVPSEAEKTARGNDAGEQTAAPKSTEKLRAEARAAQEDAAVQAFLLAQEAGRQAQAARDAAAAKEAAQGSRAARQNANRPFLNGMFGIR